MVKEPEAVATEPPVEKEPFTAVKSAVVAPSNVQYNVSAPLCVVETLITSETPSSKMILLFNMVTTERALSTSKTLINLQDTEPVSYVTYILLYPSQYTLISFSPEGSLLSGTVKMKFLYFSLSFINPVILSISSIDLLVKESWYSSR